LLYRLVILLKWDCKGRCGGSKGGSLFPTASYFKPRSPRLQSLDHLLTSAGLLYF
jgi:hypothetical protein